MAETLVRKRRRRSKYPAHWWVIPVAATLITLALSWFIFRPTRKTDAFVLEGFITDSSIVSQEFFRYYGKRAGSPTIEQQFQDATKAVEKRDFEGAATLLEAASQQASLPAIYNNLGVIYAQLGDRSRTVNAFREALARDSGYTRVRENLDRMKGSNSDLENLNFAVTRELEPNDTEDLANLMSLDKTVEAEIGANGDVDCFRLAAPAAPRDILRIEVDSTPDLAPVMSLYDSQKVLMTGSQQSAPKGVSLVRTIALEPNSMLYLKIWGGDNTAGKYTVTVRATKSFDAYEPNDQIFAAHKISVGELVQANIMDARDTDFYAFVSPRTGDVSILIDNVAATLIPALTTFSPDMRNSGFGPDVRTPGKGLKHTMKVEENQMYFLQVWSQGNSSGGYSLLIQ